MADTAMTATSSWLDFVPGARAAYDYVVRKVSEFQLVGLQKIPAAETLLNTLRDRVAASRDASLQGQFDFVAQETGALKSNWRTVDEKLRGFLAQIRSAGLGALPVAGLVALAALAVTVGGAMLLFFKRAENHDALVRDFAADAVAKGLLSAEEATRILQGGGPGFLAGLGSGLTTVALVAAAIYFLPRVTGRKS